MRYNYVICGNDNLFCHVAYHDLFKLDNVIYFGNYYIGIESTLLKFLIRITFSRKIHRLVPYFIKQIAYRKIFPSSFNTKDPICYLFFGDNEFLYQSSYIDFLKKKYEHVITVLYFQDLVYVDPYFNLRTALKKNDYFITYDKGESERFKFHFHPTPYSFFPVTRREDIDDIDVYFCGFAKNRLDIIMNMFYECKKHLLKCAFFLYEVPKDKQIESEEIIYDHPLNYIENLEYVVKSKCVLEAMQKDADGYTPRVWEAVFYGKHLLTNNIALKNSHYYYTGMHFYPNDISDISSWIYTPVNYPQSLKDSLSPINFLHFIEDKVIIK